MCGYVCIRVGMCGCIYVIFIVLASICMVCLMSLCARLCVEIERQNNTYLPSIPAISGCIGVN